MRRIWGVLADYLSALRGTIWIRLHRAHPRTGVIWLAAASATVASFTLFWFGVGGKGAEPELLDRPATEAAGAIGNGGTTAGPGRTPPPGGSGSTVTTSGTGTAPGATASTTPGGNPVTSDDPTWQSPTPGGPASSSTIGTAPPSSGSTTSTTGVTTTPTPSTTAPPADDGVVGGLFDLLGGLFGG